MEEERAERAGFEPATHLSARTRFPVALLRPLGHLSVLGHASGWPRTVMILTGKGCSRVDLRLREVAVCERGLHEVDVRSELRDGPQMLARGNTMSAAGDTARRLRRCVRASVRARARPRDEQWKDEAEAFAGWIAVCSHCYEEIRT